MSQEAERGRSDPYRSALPVGFKRRWGSPAGRNPEGARTVISWKPVLTILMSLSFATGQTRHSRIDPDGSASADYAPGEYKQGRGRLRHSRRSHVDRKCRRVSARIEHFAAYRPRSNCRKCSDHLRTEFVVERSLEIAAARRRPLGWPHRSRTGRCLCRDYPARNQGSTTGWEGSLHSSILAQQVHVRRETTARAAQRAGFVFLDADGVDRDPVRAVGLR